MLLDKKDTVLCADSVEFLPQGSIENDCLVVGTYEVLEGGSAPSRTGRLFLYTINHSARKSL